MNEFVRADLVEASDVLVFAGGEYKVRSVIVKSDHVKIVLWNTNEEQPYVYERHADLERKVS